MQGLAEYSKAQVWTGRVVSGLAVALLFLDAVVKVLRVVPVVESTVALGYPAASVMAIGLVELVCIVAYVVPRTSLIGAVLLTGYLGGAVASHVRIESPLFSHVLFPVYVAVLVWCGWALRNEGARSLLLWPGRTDRSLVTSVR